jgi:hypothetical protein
MIAIASLLNMQANQRIQHMWDLLDANCGLSEMKLTPLPHLPGKVLKVINWILLKLRYKGWHLILLPLLY